VAPSGERCLTGPCPGLNTGQGPVRGQGRGGKKKKPHPRPLSGAGGRKQPGPRIFRGPGGPVTNSKHGRLQAFNNIWKALLPYQAFLVPKKPYREVTQWQGKEIRYLGCCILGVLTVALRQAGGAQVIFFKRALECVSALVDFNMIAQYRSHTSDTILYMEDYLDQFHKLKDIFLEFRVTKRMQDKVDKQRRESRRQRALVIERVAPSLRRRMRNDNCQEENNLRLDLVRGESHFNFIKMHLLSHFCDHICQFGNIPMYSTKIGELAHRMQIKDG